MSLSQAERSQAITFGSASLRDQHVKNSSHEYRPTPLLATVASLQDLSNDDQGGGDIIYHNFSDSKTLISFLFSFLKRMHHKPQLFQSFYCPEIQGHVQPCM